MNSPTHKYASTMLRCKFLEHFISTISPVYVMVKGNFQIQGNALRLCAGRGNHVELSVEDFVAFVLEESEVIVVVESDVCLSHNL
jgi:hypothetical protein